MSRIGFDHHYAARPVYRNIAPEKIVNIGPLRFLPFIIPGKGLDIPVMPVGDLAHLEKFQIP
jgi:hypothetical protein